MKITKIKNEQLPENVKAYKCNDFKVIVSNINKWYMTIKHYHRVARLNEIIYMKERLIPKDVRMAIIVPGEDEYVKDPACIQLVEIEFKEEQHCKG